MSFETACDAPGTALWGYEDLDPVPDEYFDECLLESAGEIGIDLLS